MADGPDSIPSHYDYSKSDAAEATAAPPAHTEGKRVALSTDLAGNLRVTGGGGGGGGPATIADSADVTQGAIADAAVTGDNTGTLSAKLRGLIKILGDVWDSVNHRLKVDGSAVTQPVSAASLPLPSGAATGAKQDTGNTSVASIDGKIPADPAKESGHLATIDTNLALVAKDATLGAVGTTPGAYTVLDRLSQLGVKLDAINKTEQALLALQTRPVSRPSATLLHRS